MTQTLDPAVEAAEPGMRVSREAIGPVSFALSIAAIALVFLVAIAPQVSLEPGDSHDGRNAGLWTVGARSLLENGPIDSRLGADAPERGVYANHPPGVVWETAFFLVATGEDPWSRKAPAYVSSLAAIALSAILMRRLGYSRIASVAGTGLMATAPMLLVFGASPNMEAVSLPWMFLVLIAWADPFHRHAPWMAALGVVGCVWMYHASLLLAVIVGVLSLVRIIQGRATPIDRPNAKWALAAGLLLGAWLTWANQGLSRVLSQGGKRLSLGDIGLANWLERQSGFTGDVFGWPLLLAAVAGIVVAARTSDSHRRTAVLLGALVPLAYLLVTMDGAWAHEYWNYAMLVPVAIGTGAGVDFVLTRATLISPAAVLIGALLLAATGLSARIPAHSLFADGADAAVLLERVELPADQATALTYPLVVGPLSWVEWSTRLPTENLFGPGPLSIWASENPNDEVLVEQDGVRHIHSSAMWDEVLALAGGRAEGQYALVSAGELSALADRYGLDHTLPTETRARLSGTG